MVATDQIGLLLFATFLSTPLTTIGRAFSDTRFLVAVLFLNFVLIPPVVWVLWFEPVGEGRDDDQDDGRVPPLCQC